MKDVSSKVGRSLGRPGDARSSKVNTEDKRQNEHLVFSDDHIHSTHLFLGVIGTHRTSTKEPECWRKKCFLDMDH